MRRIVFIFVFVSFLSLVWASFDVHNISIDTSYPLNQILQGEVNITVRDMDSNVRLTSNKGHDALFLDLLDNNSALYDCFPDDCGNRYGMGTSESSLDFEMVRGDNVFFGFVLRGSDVYVKDVLFDISSDFGEEITSPLRMNIFEGAQDWVFDEYSGTDTGFRDIRFGNFYDEDYGVVGPIISDITFCSEFFIYETDRVRIGFVLDTNNGSGELTVSVYDKDTGLPISSNDFDASGGLNTVEIESLTDDLFSSGTYYVCVEATDTTVDYRLYEDTTSGEYGAFSYSGFEFNYSAAIFPHKTKNYGIFLQEAVYADASRLRNFNFSVWRNVANSLISLKYGGNCSLGCVFPIAVRAGVAQNFNVDNVAITYSREGVSGGSYIETGISKLDVDFAKMFFSGVLDFGALGFVMNESGTFKLSLDGEEILSETIKITAAPIIKGVYPSKIPAGVNALLFADVDYGGSGSLVYEWDFGDGSSQTTTNNMVYHLYTNISAYTVTLTVKDGDLSNFIEVVVNTVSPKDYVDAIYYQMSFDLNSSIKDIESFPAWQKKTLTNFLNIVSFEDDLRRIARKIREAIDDSDYIEIAGMVNVLDIPKAVFVSETFTYDSSLIDSIDIDAVLEYTGESLDSGSDNDDYAAAIARWQDENVEFSVVSKQVSLLKTSGVVQQLFVTYLVTLKSDFDDESFFVIAQPREDITFNSILKEPKTYGGLTFLPLGIGSATYEFFVLGGEGVEFFASPLFRDLVLEAEITQGCNFNNICEEGETPSICRSDCKPVGLMIFYIIFAFFVGLFLYTGIQVWYMKSYEKTLFPAGYRLNNVLMFITSSQTNGKSQGEIRRMLRDKGWTTERVDYALRKANGERTGLYEVIPISKISAYFRRKKVVPGSPTSLPVPLHHPRSSQSASGSRYGALVQRRPVSQKGGRRGARGIATSSRQQMGRKINKDDSQNFNRGR